MTARIHAVFGVYGRLRDDERAVLDLANEFRRDLAAIYQERHDRLIDYRNRRFPRLFEALSLVESMYWRIAGIEAEIKAHHSEVRDRNAVPAELRVSLAEARALRSEAREELSEQRAAWTAHLKEFGQWWKVQADWKCVKSLDDRRRRYAALTPPEHLADYCAMHVELDLRERELYRVYQARGLHSAIRAEIVEATQPKLGKSGPGMRYRYGQTPRPEPWQRLTLQIPGGATWREILAGSTPSLRAEFDGESNVAIVEQQIGTADQPRVVTYRTKIDKPLPLDAVIQRWTLCVRETGKRVVMPLVADAPAKPIGAGTFGYRLRWTVRPEGVEVAEFFGDNVHERLVLPAWLVERRMQIAAVQQQADNMANDFLETVGISRSKRPGSLHGVEALASYCESHADDGPAATLLDTLRRRLHRARRDSQRAARCIEDIYRSTAAKVCRAHSAVWHPPLDLAKLKRYDTRDLLREDVLPERSREIMHAVAPGKLRLWIKGYGLATADVEPELPADARGTDLFTTYVASLGGGAPREHRHRDGRSQTSAAGMVAQ